MPKHTGYECLIQSLRLCADSIDPIAECSFADCIASAEQTGEFNPFCQADLMYKAAAALEVLAKNTLPVKLGDSVYRICWWNHSIEEGHVSMLQQKADGTWKFRFSNSSSIDIKMDEIGNTVWLTRKEAEAVLMKQDIKVISYEVGRDESNILGSGTDYIRYWSGKSEEEAFNQFNMPHMTYLQRKVRIDGHLVLQYYNRWTHEWE